MRLLMLGGTRDAVRLAGQCQAQGHEVIYSLAGKARLPDLRCECRVGGFSDAARDGREGLARFIEARGIERLVDASHPYAAQISDHAVSAAERTGLACWRLERPSWQPQSGEDWHEHPDMADLVAALAPFRRPLFTLGQWPLARLATIPAHQHWLIRVATGAPPVPESRRYRVIESIGPFTEAHERHLMHEHGTDVLVSKNSGGDSVAAKLGAARALGLPVRLLGRPVPTPAHRHFHSPATLLEALNANASLLET